jgi:hypothetical protein
VKNYVVKAGIGVAVFLLVCIGSIQIYTKYQGKKSRRRESNFPKNLPMKRSQKSRVSNQKKSKYHNKIMTLSYKILAKSF